MDHHLKNQKLSNSGKPSNSASRYKTAEQTELAFTPKPFISSRASKNSVRQESLIKPAEDKPIRIEKKVNFKVNSHKYDGDSREYGPTMPPEVFQGGRSENFGNEKERSGEIDEKGAVEEGGKLGDESEERVNEESLSKEVVEVGESENVDTRESTNRYPLHTYQPRLAQASLKYSQQRKTEKNSFKAQPLFSSILSAEDMERIKKVKEFVKSKDTLQQKTIAFEMMPFKEDPIKNKRCFNFFCEMEGLEIGGVTAARLMTASEIRKERQEFTDFYQQWKTSNSSQSPDPVQLQDSKVLTQPDLKLPSKRPAAQPSSQHPHKSTLHHSNHN